MIVTNPEVVKYIEKFEALKVDKAPSPDTELAASEQVTLYTITEMFSMDEIFRLYLLLLTRDFAKKTLTLTDEELSKALSQVVSFALHLNSKG